MSDKRVEMIPLDGQVYGHLTYMLNGTGVEIFTPMGRYGIRYQDCEPKGMAADRMARGWGDVIAAKLKKGNWHEVLAAVEYAFKQVNENREASA